MSDYENEPPARVPEPEQRNFQLLGTSQQLAALLGALATAQGAFKPIVKNKSVTIKSEKGSYSFDYADLATSIDAVRESLSAHGLALTQPFSTVGNSVTVHTMLSHKDGGIMMASCVIARPGAMKDLGSQLTYARRYAFNAMLCLAADEDLDDQPETARGESGASSGPRRTPEVPAAARQQATRPPATQVPASARPASTQAPGGPAAAPKASPTPSHETAGSTQQPAPEPKPTSTPAAASQPSASTTATPAATTSQAPTGSPEHAPKSEPAMPPASAVASASAADGPITEEDKAKMHGVLEQLGIGKPARNGYVADIMKERGLGTKFDRPSFNAVMRVLLTRQTEKLQGGPGL